MNQQQMLKTFIRSIVFSLFSFINGNAQSNIDNKSSENSYITFNLFSPINNLNPRWRVGYIKPINEKWKIGLDAGYGNRNISLTGLRTKIGENYQLWEIRPELYYILKPDRKTKNYFSLELFFINHKDVFYDDYFYTENNGAFSYDKANYFRKKYGFNLKYGFIIYSKKRVGFNVYTGLGLRFRKNTFSNVENPNTAYLGPEGGDMLGIYYYKNTEGTRFGANFSFGMKLYYRLK